MARKKHSEPEYRLRVFHYHDETSRHSLAVVVETVKEFVNFHYQIVLQDEQAGNVIRLKILGLHAPVSSMPGVGPARGYRFYPPPLGSVRFQLLKPDGGENEFVATVDRASVKLTRSPEHPFAYFSTEPVPLET